MWLMAHFTRIMQILANPAQLIILLYSVFPSPLLARLVMSVLFLSLIIRCGTEWRGFHKAVLVSHFTSKTIWKQTRYF
jgi:hypothetical protein